MKKILLAWILAIALVLGACGQADPASVPDPDPTDATEYPAAYRAITAIDHSVLEPDERAALTQEELAAYRVLTDALLARDDQAILDVDASRTEYLLDLLRESPYYFFASDAKAEGICVKFTYAYSAGEQQRMQELMDSELLEIANKYAAPDDNELDIVLKIYSAVTHRIRYDLEREDNKQLGSPLFDYPADEVYKALRDGKSLCYGFAYIMRYALLQRGIDAFCVYGDCLAREAGHEWVVFRYDGQYYHCDPAWDRAEDEYAKLLHFGKTDGERIADTLVMRDFSEYHEADYPAVVCSDDRFEIFRDIVRFSYANGHCFYIENRKGKEAFFDTETFTVSG